MSYTVSEATPRGVVELSVSVTWGENDEILSHRVERAAIYVEDEDGEHEKRIDIGEAAELFGGEQAIFAAIREKIRDQRL